MTRDPLDDLGPEDRGLAALLGHLTSEPTADELSGEYAALTMFRAVRTAQGDTVLPASTVRPATRHGVTRRRRASRLRIGGRLAAAGSVVALAGGFAAAGYAEVLPAPLQQVAHRILGFAGVPNSPSTPGSRQPTVPATAANKNSHGQPGSSPSSLAPTAHSPRSHSHSHSHSHSRHSRSASPGPRGPAPKITVTLLRRQRSGPQQLIVSVPLARRGDVVQLEALVAGRWSLVRAHRLRQGGQTEFSVPARKISVTYRVVLAATAEHSQSVSASVTVAVRPPHKGG